MGGVKAAGLVRSVRGTRGGYEITRDPGDITAFQVVSALEEEMLPAPCVKNPEGCPLAEGCTTRDVWCRMAACIDETLKGVTLKELAAQEPEDRGSFTCPF
jgi:Rrf2 family protein